MKIIIFILLLIYVAYLTISFKKNGGFTESLSATYYLWPKWVFPLFLTVIGLTILPIWLEETTGSDLQFLSFLSCLGFLFIGFAPDYKNDKGQYKLHMLCAYFIIFTAFISMIFVMNGWYYIILIGLIGYLLDRKQFKQHITLHVENSLILPLLLSLID